MSKNRNEVVSSPLVFFFILGHCWTATVVHSQSSTHQTPIPFTSLLNTVATAKVTDNPTATSTPGRMSTIDPSSSLNLSSLEQRPSNSRFPRNSNRNSKNDLIARVSQIPKERLHRYKVEAARQLQVSLIRVFSLVGYFVKVVEKEEVKAEKQEISLREQGWMIYMKVAKKKTFQAFSGSVTAAHRLPNNIRLAARKALLAAQAGNYNPAIVNHLPTILRLGSQQQGHPAKQLQAILTTIIPHVPPTSRGQLQGILGFLSAKITIANTLLTSVLGTVPDLLSGVIKSLTNNLGAVTGALNGTLASLGSLLGGILG